VETLSEAIQRLRDVGYTADFVPTESGQLRCPACGSTHDPADMTIDEQLRFEGESDPADMSLLVALTCACGAKGLYSTQFGPEIGPEDAAVVRALPRS
jgi:hypothetical protein